MTIADTIFHNQYLLKDIFSYARPRSRYCNLNIAETIAERGLLKLLQLKAVHDCYLIFGKGVMDLAARNGHLETVQWLHENRSELGLRQQGCTDYAMDWAAMNGHLHVVKWLHENRSEGCTRWGMNWAAMNGHLHVVKWWYKNRTERCTCRAMDWAAAAGHLPVIDWLHKKDIQCTCAKSHCPATCCATNIMVDAARNGYLDVVKWLHKNHYACTTDVMMCAARNGHLDVVKWLFVNCAACTDTTRAMNEATPYDRRHVIKWLQQKMNNRNNNS